MSGTRAISTTSRRELSSSFFPPARQGAEGKIHAILTETLACFLTGRAKELSASLYIAGGNRIILVVKVGGKSSYCCLLYVLPSLTFRRLKSTIVDVPHR